jgi:hypothetical protein
VHDGEIARNARCELKLKTGKSAVSALNAKKRIRIEKGENKQLEE